MKDKSFFAGSTDAEQLTRSYDYELPEELIADEPVSPADTARLLVFDRRDGSVIHSRFDRLDEHLPSGVRIFFNDTRVIKARLLGRKETGGAVELLVNKARDSRRFDVMIRGRVRVGSRLIFDEGLEATVHSLQSDGTRIVTFARHGRPLDFEGLVAVCEQIGHVPLPPYIRRSDRPEDSENYQSLFAARNGAVAAPTASLHFTSKLLERLGRTHPFHTLTLHVGAGTFKPVESERILEHPMHSERFLIPREAARILDGFDPILAVGTTVTRTVEYYARTGALEGECDLFLHPGNPPRRVNHLLTNFHLPRSTLIMLVSAFIGREKTLELYRLAIAERYRFYSYGDAMLIL